MTRTDDWLSAPRSTTARPPVPAGRPWRRWRRVLAFLCCVLLAGGGAAAVKLATVARVEFAGVLQHTPLPSAEVGRHLLPASDLRTLAGAMKSPDVLGPAAASAGVPAAALGDLLDARPAVGAQTLTVSLRWPEARDDGAAVLDRVLGEFVRHCGDLRRQRLDDRAADLQKAIAASSAEADAARSDLRDLYRRTDTVDLPQDIRSATAAVEASAVALAQVRRAETNGRAQLAEVNKLIESLTRGDSKGGEPLAAASTLGPRVTWLQFMIDQTRLNKGSDATLAAKRQELEAIRKGYQQGAASRIEVIRLEGEVNQLETKAKDDAEIRSLKQELAALVHAAAPPELQQAAAKKFDLQLQVSSARHDVSALEAEQEQARGRLDRLLTAQTDGAPLARAIERCEGERNRLQVQLDQLRSIRAIAAEEAVVLQPAAVVTRPYAAARRWVAPALVFALTLLLGHLALFGGAGRDPGVAADDVVLPVLASVRPARTAGDVAADAGVRSLALAIRQRLPRPGAAVLFATLQPGYDSRNLMLRTAATLARRDERVLLLDAVLPGDGRFNAPGTPHPRTGLSNYLAFEATDPHEVIQPTSDSGVDLLPVGTATVSPDELATHRMRELMERLRQTYSVILVHGPALAADTDVQILSGYQDATVVLRAAGAPVPAPARQILRECRQIGLPLLGYVALVG